MSLLKLTIVAHTTMSRQPLTEVRTIACGSHSQVAAALAEVHHYCRRLAGRGSISRVEILRERR